LDVGKRRIGVAISDELRLTAQGLETIQGKNIREVRSELAGLAARHGVSLFLIGNPLNMSGDAGPQAEWVRSFSEDIAARTGIPVKLWDERLTTREAGRVLRASGIGIEKRARAIDRLSAVILLQSYLDSLAVE
jgi:putative Holliday junction resolvase